ncbi:2Fe-2S iron-sulfur cluster-binding protein [Aliidiomarina sp.]|uniref:2Fe-2S iron-sulfur cluster-binding protein n=1 Tax=Aliidiomarina sp. TaxID=1872439 RepID=UPI003A4DDD11|nr:2Fe-2S iron-sulfur cluster binding domain-containing protein [Idiomarina sp.]
MPTAIFIDANGGQYEAEAKIGDTLMEVATENGIDGIIGECGGVMSCATCHVYVDNAWLDKLPPADEVEESMIDMAINPEDNSRLSCQITMTDDLNGIIVRMPVSQF